ncbi:MAG: DUF4870 domain-containing protein [Nocardioidaceae bacterium]
MSTPYDPPQPGPAQSHPSDSDPKPSAPPPGQPPAYAAPPPRQPPAYAAAPPNAQPPGAVPPYPTSPGAEWSAPYPPSSGRSGQFHPQGSDPHGSPATLTPDDRNWAMAAHLGVLVAAFLAMGFLAPLAVLLFAGYKSDFVRRHATESLNFQISLLIYLVVGTVSALVITLATLGLAVPIIVAVAAAVAIFALIAIIMATMAASRGEDFRYPLCLRLIH